MTDTTKDNAARVSRRSLLLSSGAAAILSLPAIRPSYAQNRRIVARDPGGPIGALYREVFYEPFKKETGISVVNAASDSDPSGQIKAMVEAKNYAWDMATLSSSNVENLGADYLEALDNLSGPNVKGIDPKFRRERMIGTAVSSVNYGFRSDRLNRAPKDPAEFYDLAALPGRRLLRKHPQYTLEMALLADGVPVDKLYPLDVERGLKKLDAVKRSNPVWWTASAQITQALTSGEANFVAGFANRIGYAFEAGIPGEVIWKGGVYFVEGWAVLKGTPNAALCKELIEFSSAPERQAAWAPKMRLGFTHPKAAEHMTQAQAALLPTNPANLAQMAQTDDTYWRTEQTKIIERFNAWLVS